MAKLPGEDNPTHPHEFLGRSYLVRWPVGKPHLEIWSLKTGALEGTLFGPERDGTPSGVMYQWSRLPDAKIAVVRRGVTRNSLRSDGTNTFDLRKANLGTRAPEPSDFSRLASSCSIGGGISRFCDELPSRERFADDNVEPTNRFLSSNGRYMFRIYYVPSYRKYVVGFSDLTCDRSAPRYRSPFYNSKSLKDDPESNRYMLALDRVRFTNGFFMNATLLDPEIQLTSMNGYGIAVTKVDPTEETKSFSTTFMLENSKAAELVDFQCSPNGNSGVVLSKVSGPGTGRLNSDRPKTRAYFVNLASTSQE
ncbi:hypothetical protein [Calycomorphotria hydatis]|uniref:hypothetical protein n=1 Tax=Calycomorphotria hydatis TaxID=2528027 RepID=UPI0011A9A924|nr:hypothetical protein [Calycomorphotria hydatis]